LIARGFGDGADALLEELRVEAGQVLEKLLTDDVTEISSCRSTCTMRSAASSTTARSAGR